MVPESTRLEYEAIIRLAAARDNLDLVLTGRWAPDPVLVGAIARLVGVAGRFCQAAA